KLLDFRKRHNFVESAVDFLFAHAEDAAIEVDVFAACEFRMEAGADFQKAADTAVDFDMTGRPLGNLAEDLQQRAFSRAVAADDADDSGGLHLEGDILQGPELLGAGGSLAAETAEEGRGRLDERFAQCAVAASWTAVDHVIFLAQVVDANRGGHCLQPEINYKATKESNNVREAVLDFAEIEASEREAYEREHER